MSPSTSLQALSQVDPVAALPETVDDFGSVFSDWTKLPRDISIFDRVLISLLSASYAQRPSDQSLEDYLSLLTPEVRRAFLDRTDSILRLYKEEYISSLREEISERMWIDATKYGIRANLDEFANSQVESYRELRESFRKLESFVRERTSFRTQAFLAFAIALGLSVFVGVTKLAVTVADDIWPSHLPAPTSSSTPKQG